MIALAVIVPRAGGVSIITTSYLLTFPFRVSCNLNGLLIGSVSLPSIDAKNMEAGMMSYLSLFWIPADRGCSPTKISSIVTTLLSLSSVVAPQRTDRLLCGSKSINNTFLPRSYSPAASDCAVVLLPTPPFWLAIA